MSTQTEATQVLHIWDLDVPLPAVLIITVTFYMMLVGVGLWIRFCLKDRCSAECGHCGPDVSVSEQCFRIAETCDCRPPTVRSCLNRSCPSPTCLMCDCACTCQPPECESCNCLCFEIRIK